MYMYMCALRLHAFVIYTNSKIRTVKYSFIQKTHQIKNGLTVTVTYLEFSSSIIFLILLLAFSDFSALAQAGCRAEDLISSS